MIEVFSDGSSGSRGGKPGGYGWVICQDHEILYSGLGGSPSTTNNVMELTGAIEGLAAVVRSNIKRNREVVLLISDSQYVVDLANGDSQPNRNRDLAHQLRRLILELTAGATWTRGHQYRRGVPIHLQDRYALLNERCDQLANIGKAIQLIPKARP